MIVMHVNGNVILIFFSMRLFHPGFLSSKMNECLFICKVSNTVVCDAPPWKMLNIIVFITLVTFFMLHKGVNR